MAGDQWGVDGGLLSGWNGLDIEYTALLSAPGANAIDRLNLAGPVYGLDGALVATGAADFFDGTLASGIHLDEMFGEQSGARVWTGTGTDCRVETRHCSGWTNANSTALGLTTFADNPFNPWIFAGDYQCHQQARLFGVSPLLTVPLPLAGDYDGDQQVDGDDLTAWQQTYGQPAAPYAGADDNSLIEGATC